MAVIKGNKDIVRALVNIGADLNIKDNDNKTALDYAESNNFEEIKKYCQMEDINNFISIIYTNERQEF